MLKYVIYSPLILSAFICIFVALVGAAFWCAYHAVKEFICDLRLP